MDKQTFLTVLGFVGPGPVQTPVPAVAAAISDLTATGDTDSITLDWTNNDTYNDVVIQRKTASTEFADIDTIDGAEVTYDDVTVELDITYTYRVSGLVDNDLRRNYSNEASDMASA